MPKQLTLGDVLIPLDDYTVAYFPFKNNPATHNGIFPNNDAQYIYYNDGIHGGCLATNKSFGKLFYNIPDMDWTKPWTISGWVKRNSFSAERSHYDDALFGVDYGGSNASLHITFRYDKPHLGFYGNDLTSTTTILDKEWHHYFFVWDGTYQRIYIDGVEDCNRSTYALNSTVNGIPFEIASIYTNNSLSKANTIFSDIRIDQIARTPEEIKTWYDYNNRFYIPYNGGIEMSKAHIGSNLIIKNSLVGVDDSTVAYFPFKNSINDIVKGTVSSVSTTPILSEDGIFVEEGTTNLWSGNLIIYNNYKVPATLELLDETYLGQPVYRLGMTVDDANSDALSNFQTALYSHGVYGSYRTYLANTKYAASIYWRPVNKTDVVVGGTASNIGGWSSTPTEDCGDGWHRYTQTRNGTVTTDKSDNVFFSFYCPSLALNETVYIDWCCPQIEESKNYNTSYILGTRDDTTVTIPQDLLSYNTGTIDYVISPGRDSTEHVSGTYYGGRVDFSWHRYHQSGFTIRRSQSKIELMAQYADATHLYITKSLSWEAKEDIRVTTTWDSTSVKFYINAEYVGVLDKFAQPVSTELAYIGRGYNGNTSMLFSNSHFKDFKIYKRALSDNEIKQLHLNNNSFYFSNEEVTLL